MLIKRSIAAAILISMGVYGLLATNYSVVSMFLFAFGLMSICVLKLNLFTGKCGYVIENKNLKELLIILVFNMLAGYAAGFVFSFVPGFCELAASKCAGWNWSLVYFFKSIMCGMIMFLAVDIHKKGSPLGILLGIPMFIICGFQHCIANVITMGCARTFSSPLILCAAGNWAGSLIMWWLCREKDPILS